MTIRQELFEKLNDIENVSYEPNKNRWVVWDNDTSKADQIKHTNPHAIVYLFNPDNKKYTRYTISIIHRKPHMKNGKLLYEEETIEV